MNEFLTRIAMPRERGARRDGNGWMAGVGMGHRRGHANGKGERGRLARSGRHLADRPESQDKDPSPRHRPGRRRLAGKMPARMPALPRHATQQSLPQFSRQAQRRATRSGCGPGAQQGAGVGQGGIALAAEHAGDFFDAGFAFDLGEVRDGAVAGVLFGDDELG